MAIPIKGAKWEVVNTDSEYTDRLKVPGGWLYRTQATYDGRISVAMVFVADEKPCEVCGQ